MQGTFPLVFLLEKWKFHHSKALETSVPLFSDGNDDHMMQDPQTTSQSI
jgi:hypothetical protein